MLGAVARACAARARRRRAELPALAVVERLVVVVGVGVAVDVDRRAGGRGQPAVAGDVVGVVVGLEDVLDAHAHVARELEVLVDLEARVDDGGDARVLVADQVGGAAEVVVGDLAEDHVALRGAPAGLACSQASMPPLTLRASRPDARARPQRPSGCGLPVRQMKATGPSSGSSPARLCRSSTGTWKRALHVAVLPLRHRSRTSTSASSPAFSAASGVCWLVGLWSCQRSFVVRRGRSGRRGARGPASGAATRRPLRAAAAARA